jgi:hypothetical protein
MPSRAARTSRGLDGCGGIRAHASRRAIVPVAVLLLLAILAPASDAAGDDLPEQPFRDGSWTGTLAASGVVDGRFPEADATMNTLMSGTFDAHVLDGEVSGGTWTLNGSSDGIIFTEFSQGQVSNTFFGAGPVGGDADGLELGGAVDTTWHLQVGGHTDTNQDPIRLGPFDVEVLHLDCNTLLGRWEHAFEAQVDDAGGWEATLGGTFQASHLGDDPAGPVADLVEDVTDEAQALLAEVTTGDLDGPGGTVTIDEPLRQRFRSLITVASSVEVQIAELGSAAECLFPGTVGTFGLVITSIVQEAARVLLTDHSLDAAGLEFMAEQLLAVGGAGPAALPNPRVANLEELFSARVSEVLSEAALTNPEAFEEAGCVGNLPCLPVEPQVVQALRAADLLFLPVTIDGQRYEWAEVHVWLVLADSGQLP